MDEDLRAGQVMQLAQRRRDEQLHFLELSPTAAAEETGMPHPVEVARKNMHQHEIGSLGLGMPAQD